MILLLLDKMEHQGLDIPSRKKQPKLDKIHETTVFKTLGNDGSDS